MEPKILVISNYSGPLNAIRPEAEIFVSLIKKGVKITIMTPAKSHYGGVFKELGAEVIDYRPTKKIDFKAISLIREVVKRKHINIVHAFHSKAIVNSVITLMGSSVKLVGYRGYTGNIHWYDPSCYVAFLNPRVDYMICLADSVREMFLKNGMPGHKAITINKGHDPNWYADIQPIDLKEFDIPEGALTCSFVANYRTKMKGLHDLIKASDLLPENVLIRFLLIGNGMDTPQILDQIENSKHPERFVFTGFRNDASSIVKACDISISVSLFGEATQKAMIEAMFLGNPVIMSTISGNRGMVVDSEGGYLVEPNNPQQIAAAIGKFWSNRGQISSMGLAAKKHIGEFLDQARTVREYAEFYQQILND